MKLKVFLKFPPGSIVDEAIFLSYQERGGKLDDLDKINLTILEKYLLKNNLSKRYTLYD